MGYYIRVLTPSDRVPTPGELQATLDGERRRARVTVEAGTPEAWEQIVLSHADGREIASIERDVAARGLVGSDEIREFIEELDDGEPKSSAEWLREYLPRVRTIYAFQVLSGADVRNGWASIHALIACLHSSLGGIIQADGEGFSNENGDHILWQFDDDVRGKWWMALLQDGKWVRFRMNLGNLKQRAAFMRGEIPPGVELGSPEGQRDA